MGLDSDRVQKPIRKIRKFLKKSLRRPTVDQIHDFRTSSRRFESTAEALGLSSRRNERRLLRDLRLVRRRAGKVRDMDVLTGHVLGIREKSEQDCLVQLVEYLGEERNRQVKKLRRLIVASGVPLRRRLKRSKAKLDDLAAEEADNAGDSVPQQLEGATARALTLSAELKSPPRLNRNNLHPYRLKVKELRYVLQLSSGADQQKFVDMLGEVKDAIGEWHDWEELTAIAADVLDHGSPCKLMFRLKSTSDERFAQALSLANEMRERYIPQASSRNSRRNISANRSRYHAAPSSQYSRPVWAAASAITGR